MSFLTLGIFWYQHHNQFHFIKRVDPTLIFINIAGLMFIVLIPFTTVLVGDYHHTLIAAVIFELNLFIAGIIFFLHWVYATTRRRLVDSNLDAGIIRWYKERNLIIPAVSLVGISLSLINPILGTSVYFTVPFILLIMLARQKRS